MDQLTIRQSQNRGLWWDALANADDVALDRAVASDPPGVSLLEIETFVSGIYHGSHMGGDPISSLSPRAERAAARGAEVRRQLGPRQQQVDIAMMRMMCRSGALSAVVGAGATKDAGGPDWPELVTRLISVVLQHESDATGATLSDDDAATAKRVLRAIGSGNATPDQLMSGAELCYRNLGEQRLFTQLNPILYGDAPTPGAIHRAIATLSHPVRDPERARWAESARRQSIVAPQPDQRFPGWDAIVTYNFDDLIGEAIDDEGVSRVAWAMRKGELKGDPNDLALKAGQDGLHQPILHLHGYTPRRPFRITHVEFVLTATQYKDALNIRPGDALDHFVGDYLANPIHYALYIGCSLTDEAMTRVLRDAAHALPGRRHFALLRWPGDDPFATCTAADHEEASQQYLDMGVRPIWFNEFSDIPKLVGELA